MLTTLHRDHFNSTQCSDHLSTRCTVMLSMMAACWLRQNSGPVFRLLWTKVHQIKFACTGVRGRARQTWLRTVENDLKQQNLGLWSARHRTYDRELRREIVETATLQQGHAT